MIGGSDGDMMSEMMEGNGEEKLWDTRWREMMEGNNVGKRWRGWTDGRLSEVNDVCMKEKWGMICEDGEGK